MRFLRGMFLIKVVITMMTLTPRAQGATADRAQPGKSSSHPQKQWNLETTPADRTSKIGFPRIHGKLNKDQRAQMLKMVTVLGEMQRMFNSTISSQMPILPKGGRNLGRRSKLHSLLDIGPPLTTASSIKVNSAVSRPNVDVGPSITVQNSRAKSQAKRHNKRVCFWKYCSQN
ncbi:urotensin II-related peptide [Synchiropus picturatus]